MLTWNIQTKKYVNLDNPDQEIFKPGISKPRNMLTWNIQVKKYVNLEYPDQEIC